MSFMIKRTTGEPGKEVVRYYVRMTGFGQMFQTMDIARRYDTYEEAEAVIEEDDLRDLAGEIEIIEVD